jgi:hypothetical protein
MELDTVADKLLSSWAAEKSSLFMIFKIAKDSGGSTSCVIDKFSSHLLRLSWPGQHELLRRGEFVLSLIGASRTISGIDPPELVSGADFINPSEPFVLITLPSGDRFWLVTSRGFELDEAQRWAKQTMGASPSNPSTPEKQQLNQQMTVITSVGSKQRKTTIKVGKEYVIQPLNILKKKHRDRRCLVLGFVAVSDSHPRDIVARVRFRDNNRIGRAELDDLVSIRRS